MDNMDGVCSYPTVEPLSINYICGKHFTSPLALLESVFSLDINQIPFKVSHNFLSQAVGKCSAESPLGRERDYLDPSFLSQISP